MGRLANTGKNFWTVEPTVGFVYFGQKNGIEAAGYFGVDFNSENSATSYKSGTQAHFEGTLAQQFPLWGGRGGAGVAGFWYQQLTDDSGEGANLGGFRSARPRGTARPTPFSRQTTSSRSTRGGTGRTST